MYTRGVKKGNLLVNMDGFCLAVSFVQSILNPIPPPIYIFKIFIYEITSLICSSIKNLAEKGCWDVAEARTNNDRQLMEYLVSNYFHVLHNDCHSVCIL